ncbi:MAG TPA: heparinase II/III family protein [Magnetospirillum sp.]|jgi:hypothetical protein|nr:heparinase II/III family protein [Magnetospirillum sp.]
MSLAHLIRHALAMPPREAARRVWRHARRMVGSRIKGRLMRGRFTYPQPMEIGPLARRLGPVPPAALKANAPALRRLAIDVLAHRFDLLGSGPVQVAYGVRYPGFGAHRYGPGPTPATGQDWRDWVAARHWPGNRVRVRKIFGLIDNPTYVPLDWQVDFVSGYRWSERSLGPAIAYGHLPGVDVKVPWELARLQHLPGLALAYGLDGDSRLVAEFRHQVLDFLGANPPGWGVNWACAMDVAIRAVNILLARDLFLAGGAAFDQPFEDELASAMLAHGRFLAVHLEWNEAHRGNHYLADICGLAWIAAYLPRSDETDVWLAFATQELAAEFPRQFGADGANFEASTAYHRLSAEMVLYTTALILGLPEERRTAFAAYNHCLWRRKPALKPAPMVWPPFSPGAMERLARAVRFAVDVTKPSGEMVQVGDNDSGRFVILTPGMPELDPCHLVAAARGLFDLDLTAPAEAEVETAIVDMLAGGTRSAVPTEPTRMVSGGADEGIASRVTRIMIRSDALAGMKPLAYPDFGLFIWRNARAFVSVRCGPIGQNGNGGHAHNDQLAVEIEIDGVAWTRDPGTFVYTSDLAARNAYRSASAHVVPRHGADEPARMLAPFKLENRAQARALTFGDSEFLGGHYGFGEPVWRRVCFGEGGLVIEDCLGGPAIGADTAVEEHNPISPAELARLWGLDLPFSPGYGRRV